MSRMSGFAKDVEDMKKAANKEMMGLLIGHFIWNGLLSAIFSALYLCFDDWLAALVGLPLIGALSFWQCLPLFLFFLLVRPKWLR